MFAGRSGKTPSGTGSRRRRAILHALLGLLFGYFVLHPVTMMIYRSLETVEAMPGPAMAGYVRIGSALGDSFRLHMLPMGVLFGLFCSAIGAIDGFQRATVLSQRDRLFHQLFINEQYRTRLEHLVGELEDRNERLTELELAQRRTTQFMVHDFKGHLGGIIGFSDILLDNPDVASTPGVREPLERIRRQGLRMNDAVSDLLEIARLREHGQLRRLLTPVAGVLRQAVGDLPLPGTPGHVELGGTCATCPPVLADPGLITRVLHNLTSNALRHNPPGTRVVLDAEVTGVPATDVKFSCRDNGKGIAERTVATIFDEFTAGTNSGSSGLGLAFCKAAVEAHGGHIWCESSADGGTEFWFTIPLMWDDEIADREVTNSIR